MSCSSFSVPGARVSVYCGNTALARELAQDFKQNITLEEAAAPLKLRIKLSPPPKMLQKTVSRLFPFKNGLRLRQFGVRRLITYPEGALLLYNYGTETACLWAEDFNLAHELAYLCILSRTGHRLDLRFLHRVHACGLQLNGNNLLLCGNSGVGKSTLGLLAAKQYGALLFSDDFPLVDSNTVLHPFPARPAVNADNAALRPADGARTLKRRKHGLKLLLDMDSFQATAPQPGKVNCIILLEKGGAARLRQSNGTAAFIALLKHQVLGLGLPQIAELLLPLTLKSAITLVRITLSRIKTAWSLSKNAHCYRFETGASPQEAAAALSAFRLP